MIGFSSRLPQRVFASHLLGGLCINVRSGRWAGWLALVLLGLCTVQLHGQGRSVRFEHFNLENGLSQNTVGSVIQDRAGFLWFGTQDGLNRFDGYKFKIFRNDPDNPDSLGDNFITRLYEDRAGFIWVGTRQGLYRYNPEDDGFDSFLHDPNQPQSLSDDWVLAITQTSDDAVWVGTAAGLNRLGPGESQFTHYRSEPNNPNSLSHDRSQALWEDRRRNLWVGSKGGLDCISPDGANISHMRHDPNDPNSLSDDNIEVIFQDTKGILWIGTWSGGLNRYDPKTRSITHFKHNPDQPNSISSNWVVAIFESQNGALWLGTGAGMCRFDRDSTTFTRYQHDPLDPSSLSNNRVWAVLEDSGGVLWAGTLFGGVNKLAAAQKAFIHYRAHPIDPNSLSSNTVRSFLVDENRNLWVGTDRGLNRFNSDRTRVTRFLHEEQNPKTLSDNRIWSMVQEDADTLWIGTDSGLNHMDLKTETITRFLAESGKPGLSENRIRKILLDGDTMWIATWGGGLDLLDTNTLEFTNYRHKPEDDNSPLSDMITYVYKTSDGLFWLSTKEGLCSFHPQENRFTRFVKNPDDPTAINSNKTKSLFEDSRGLLWVGTRDGLNCYDGKGFTAYTEADGLPNNVIYGICEDTTGSLWVSTNQGITCFNPETLMFRNYAGRDGLQSNEFNTNAYGQGPDGEMLFGGINGFNTFYPEAITQDTHLPPIALTRFLLFNREQLSQNRDPESPLAKMIGATRHITLNHHQSVFAFEFAALDYKDPARNQYVYRLMGFDQQWTKTGADQRFATYTNLDAGEYEFQIKGAGRNGIWNSGPSVHMTILPPPWRSWWAYSLYALGLILIVSAYVWSHRRKLEHERSINEQLRKVDRLKDDFLANTSHELRTPLNGIIGLAASLRDGVTGDLPTDTRKHLDMIVSSGKRLNSLVNNILDFSKLKNQKLSLNTDTVDLAALTDLILELSKPLAENKKLVLVNAVPTDLIGVEADESRLQQILYNLIGNGIKFTEAGSVRVSAVQEGEQVRVSIKDTGIGIPQSKYEEIFVSFEQADSSVSRAFGGTGLGLSITRQLVELHNGTIWVKSQIDKGSTFHFTLPIANEHAETRSVSSITGLDPRVAEDLRGQMTSLIKTEQPKPLTAHVEKKFKVLIVDDEPVNRQVLINFVAGEAYDILTAGSGQEALDVLKEHPDVDLILLDIMMPGMSGFEACRRIREDHSVQELPIIFLTAKNQIDDIVTGFNTGANDYSTKPVEKDELLSRISTHLELLSLSRDLELKVSERTRELSDKNVVLDSQNRELETLDRIVKTINREVELKNVIDTLLKQGFVLFPKAQKAGFLIFDKMLNKFRYVAGIGYDEQILRGINFTEDDLNRHLAENMRQEEEGVYIYSPDAHEPSPHHPEPDNQPKSMMAMTVTLDGKMVGFVSFDNFEHVDAFGQEDLKKLMRFREHAVSAVAKAKVLTDLVDAQEDLMQAAHMAGMAEIAQNVLHNIGNLLTSVQTSAEVILNELKNEQDWLRLFDKVIALFQEHQADLGGFFNEDQRSKKLPGALEQIFLTFNKQNVYLERESSRLIEQVQNLADELQEQHKFADATKGFYENVDLNRVVHDALQMKMYLLKNKGVGVVEEYSPLPPVCIEKSKFIRCLFYLLQNAREAIENRPDAGETHIIIRTCMHEGLVCLRVIDNGVGIAAENLSQLFVHGYSTKENAQGFGLHYCANTMREMDAEIEIRSDGPNTGATVCLLLKPVVQDGSAL